MAGEAVERRFDDFAAAQVAAFESAPPDLAADLLWGGQAVRVHIAGRSLARLFLRAVSHLVLQPREAASRPQVSVFLTEPGDTPAVRALVAYLSSAEGGAKWGEVGFGLSPNMGSTGNYSDPALVKLSEALASTSGFTPDIGDTIPGFGSTEFETISAYVNGGDLASLLDAAATVQSESLAGN